MYRYCGSHERGVSESSTNQDERSIPEGCDQSGYYGSIADETSSVHWHDYNGSATTRSDAHNGTDYGLPSPFRSNHVYKPSSGNVL